MASRQFTCPWLTTTVRQLYFDELSLTYTVLVTAVGNITAVAFFHRFLRPVREDACTASAVLFKDAR